LTIPPAFDIVAPERWVARNGVCLVVRTYDNVERLLTLSYAPE
jgi:hypothetical protein